MRNPRHMKRIRKGILKDSLGKWKFPEICKDGWEEEAKLTGSAQLASRHKADRKAPRNKNLLKPVIPA